MRTERRKAVRHPFIARAEIIDERENARTSSKISDLSASGCYVEMMNPFPEGTAVVIEGSGAPRSSVSVVAGARGTDALAVVDGLETKKVIGLLTEQHALRRYSEELDRQRDFLASGKKLRRLAARH